MITVCELGRLGDIVASEPIYRYLKRQYPEQRLRWYTKPAYAELFRYSPDVDEIVCVQNGPEYLKCKSELPEGTLSFELNFKDGSAPSTVPQEELAHTSLLKRFALDAGLPGLDDTPRFHFRPGVSMPPGLPEKYVLLHCMSGGRHRQWTAKNWNKLARFLLTSGMPVVEIGEAGTIRSSLPGFYDCTGRMDLHQAAKIIQNAAFFIGVESGFGHVANAVGTQSIILSGKLHQFRDYNFYSGRFGRGEGIVFARMDNVLPRDFPYDVAEAIVRRFLEGRPMDCRECSRYCRERQEKDYPQNAFSRVRSFFVWPFRELRQRLEYHKLKHSRRKNART